MLCLQPRSQTNFDTAVDDRTLNANPSKPARAQVSCQAHDQTANSGYHSQPDAPSHESTIAIHSRPVLVPTIDDTIATSAQNVPLGSTSGPQSANIRSDAGTQNNPIESSPRIQHEITAQRRINGLDVYSRDIPREVQERYRVIQGRLEEGLCNYLISKKKPLDGLTLTLMMLGKSECRAEPYIVARCESKSQKRTQKYLQKPSVKRLWQGRETSSFKVEVTMPLTPTALESLDGITGTFQDEFASAAIEFNSKGKSFFATIGGDVFLYYPDGTSKQYGLTVNHLFNPAGGIAAESTASPLSDCDPNDWSSDSDESVDSTSSVLSFRDFDAHPTGSAAREMSAQCIDSAIHDPSKHTPIELTSRSTSKNQGSLRVQAQSASAMQEQEMSSPHLVYVPRTAKLYLDGSQQWPVNEDTTQASETWTLESENPTRAPFGSLVSETLASNIARNRDWAFVEYVEQPSSEPSVNKRPQQRLEAAVFNSLDGSTKASVIYRRVMHSGRLSAVPTSMIVPGGSTFVSVYTFSFDKAPAALDGISGSWVIQEGERNIRVYGQVVAKDSFGDVYIVPMVDILHDVGKVLNVKMASLNDQEERPKTSPRPSCFVPFRRDPDFVDRAALLDQIRERCSAPASRVALVGLGGVGKSQLAIEHCYRTAECSPETWVLWVYASNTARLEQSYQEIADLVNVPGCKDPQADVFKLVHDWLSDVRNGPWLVVLDNADDAAVLSPQTDSNSALRQQLSRYLPPSRHGSVLVTSRTRYAAMQVVEDSDIIPIEPMDDAAAHALLSKKIEDKGDKMETGNKSSKDDDIFELATALDHMPLALVQASAYIRERRPRYSVRQYLDEYRQSDSRKTSLLNQGTGHLRRDKAASNSILITWQISFDHLRHTRQSAADLLSLMSFFDPQGIPKALLRNQSSSKLNEQLQAVSVDDGFEDDVLMLRDYSLVTATDEKTFEMHSLVQLATRKWLESQEQLDKWKEQFISNLCAELPTGEHENWEKCHALFPHARAALAQRPTSQKSLEEWALVLYKAAWYAWQRGRAGEAKHISMMSMELRREVLGEKSEETLKSMGLVGLTMSSEGNYAEAEAMHRETLAICDKVLGPRHLDTLTSMNNLASVLDSQGKYKEAELMYRQTLAQKEKVLGLQHPSTLVSISNLALVMNSQGKYKEAEAMHREALPICEKVLGPGHPDTLITMNNLASVLDSQGKYKEAELMYRQTLAQKEKVLGLEHPSTLASVYCLAHLLAKQRCYDESSALYNRACATYSIILGEDHPTTRACRLHSSNMFAKQEQTQAFRSPTTRRWRKLGIKSSKRSDVSYRPNSRTGELSTPENL